MIGLCDLLAGNKARTEVLPFVITRARPIYRSADIHIRAEPIYRIGYVPPIKCRLRTITLNCLFFIASTNALAFCLFSMTCACNRLSSKED